MQLSLRVMQSVLTPVIPAISFQSVKAATPVFDDTAGPALWALSRNLMMARQFGTLNAWLGSHPEGKGIDDVVIREPRTPATERTPSDSGRKNDRGSHERTEWPSGDGSSRSGGSSEKMGFAEANEKTPDSPKKGGGDIDRPASPSPAPRDPDGSLNPRRGSDDPGASWGGKGGDSGMGGGGNGNSGLF